LRNYRVGFVPDVYSQAIVSGDSLPGPQLSGFAFEIDSVPFRIEMRKQQPSWLGHWREPHGVGKLEMFWRRLVAPERAFQD
jgi:hypothetical protein